MRAWELRESLHLGYHYKEGLMAIRELLRERGEHAEATETIHVALRRQGSERWQPVVAELMPGRAYRIVSTNTSPDAERWEFPTGAVVWCEERVFTDGTYDLVAVELAG